MPPRPRRLAWSHAPLEPGLYPLPAAAVHYISRVLRLAVGAPLELFDGQGLFALAEVVEHEGALWVQVAKPATSENLGVRISIAAALPKGERADWLVEKVTELGAHELVWLTCARSVVAPHNIAAKMQRWQRVSEAAARQAGRNTLPSLRPPTPFDAVAKETFAGTCLIAHPYGDPLPPPADAKEARVLVGPEGGLTQDELHTAQSAGYTLWSFNRHILRVETAAVAAATLLAGWA